jgi:hypothetical protein
LPTIFVTGGIISRSDNYKKDETKLLLNEMNYMQACLALGYDILDPGTDEKVQKMVAMGYITAKPLPGKEREKATGQWKLSLAMCRIRS